MYRPDQLSTLTTEQKLLLQEAALAADEHARILKDTTHPLHAQYKAEQKARDAETQRQIEAAWARQDELDAARRITAADLAVVINYGLQD